MKSSLIRNLLVILAIAAVGFFVFSLLALNLSANVAFVLGSLISGGAVALVNMNTSEPSVVSSADDQNTTTLYIGNLAYKVNESVVRQHFTKLGEVCSVRLMHDKRTGKKKGFGFVEVNSEDADTMINTYNDTEFYERTLKVRLAKERKNGE